MEEGLLNTEMGKKILALTKAGFKVSDLISDHIFREKIKSQILAVYETFLQKNNQKLLGEIDMLGNLFVLGNHLDLVKSDHLNHLKNGFLVFKSQIILMMNEQVIHHPIRNPVGRPPASPVLSEPKKLDVKIRKNEKKLSERQISIMSHLAKHSEVGWEGLEKFFPDLSRRTVVYDLKELIAMGKIKRTGRGTYTLKKSDKESEESAI